MMDRFFDCLNVRSMNEWVLKRKPDLKPYFSPDDERFDWLFLKYLDDWKKYTETYKDLNSTERYKMMLSRETFEGIHITVMSFVEMAKYLLSQEDGLFVLSERFSQDPLENYFGQQRARGGRNDNPTIQQCVDNSAALRIQKSQALDPVRGNCSRKRLFKEPPQIDNTPLPKRKRVKITRQ